MDYLKKKSSNTYDVQKQNIKFSMKYHLICFNFRRQYNIQQNPMIECITLTINDKNLIGNK